MISDKELQRVARLARLKFDEAGQEKIKQDLLQVTELLMKDLYDFDCSGIKPMASVQCEGSTMRADKPAHSDLRDEIFALQKSGTAEGNLSADKQLFVVPKMLGGDE